MRKLTGMFIFIVCLNGCAINAAPGTRTEYEDKSKKIDQDYKDNKITKDDSTRLKDQASQGGKNVEQTNGSMDAGQVRP